VSNAILPIWAESSRETAQSPALDLSFLNCRIAVIHVLDGTQHILFANGARRLQLAATGADLLRAVRLLTDAVVPLPFVERRILLMRQLGELVMTGDLSARLHPPDPRSTRLGFLLQVLDGYLATASQREIAGAILGPLRVNADWTERGDYLRDRMRRAVRRGRQLMQRGYLRLLK
jgi:hypothetical protein